VRLIQRARLAEEPDYVPPTTAGFWTDKPSPPESYYAAQGDQRVLVTETRTRLYPLTPGVTTIGSATASLMVIEGGEPDDPLSLLMARARRPVIAKRAPVPVHVRPLPRGAPAGFTGAVGRFEVSWSADRARTSRDVPITVRLDVRGIGNLPLVRPPELDDPEI